MSKAKIQSQAKPVAKKTEKKISFFAAILLVIGSSIGAGTFLKNNEILTNPGNSIVLLLISWILSFVAVICMAVSLVEVVSDSPCDDGGIVTWNKTYNRKIIYKMSKNFMAYIYMPVTFFIMPYYMVMTIQDAFGWQTNWWVSALISLGFMLYFIIVSGLSSKAGNVQNQVLCYLKFAPLAFAAVIGFVAIGLKQGTVENGGAQWLPDTWTAKSGRNFLSSMFPGLGIVASIPAILFEFDGFYSAASIQSEMQHPSKTGKALAIGLLIVAIVDVVIAISLCLCSINGKLSGIVFLDSKNAHWVISVAEFIVALSVLSIINSMALWTPRFYELLVKDNELWVPEKYRHHISYHRPVIGVIYTLVVCLIIFVVFTPIGAFGYIDVNGYSGTDMISITNSFVGYGYGDNNINTLYSFVDLMGNWTSVFAFIFIIFSMLGALQKNKKIKQAHKVKGFIPCTIVSSIICGIGLLFLVVAAIGNIPLVISWKSQIGTGGYTPEKWQNDIVGVCVTFALLIVLVLIIVIPSAVAVKRETPPERKPATYSALV